MGIITEWQAGYDEGRRMGTKHMYAEVDRLKRENEALREQAEEGLAVIRTMRHQVDCYIQDAERYRWLRNGPDGLDLTTAESMEEIDALIDAAMTPSGNESVVMEISEDRSNAIGKRGLDLLIAAISKEG